MARQATPRGFAEARRAALQNKAHAGIVREELWDKRPFALDCSDRSVPNRPGQGGLYPGRHHTDVTAAGTFAIVNVIAAGLLANVNQCCRQLCNHWVG